MNNILAYTSHTTTHSGGIPLWALLLIYLGIFLVCYLIPAYFTFRVAKKLSVPDPWMAWIPIIQYYLVWKMTERSQAEVIVALVCGVLSCLAIVTVVFLCIWWAEIAKRMGKSGVVGAFAGLSSLLIGIPFLGVIASGKPDWNYIQAQRAQNVPPGYYYPQPGQYPPGQYPPPGYPPQAGYYPPQPGQPQASQPEQQAPQAWPPQQYYQPPPAKGGRELDKATIAIIISVIGIVYSFPPLVFPIVAIYLSRKARAEILSGKATGDLGYTKIAFVLGIVGIIVSLGMIAYFVWIFAYLLPNLPGLH